MNRLPVAGHPGSPWSPDSGRTLSSIGVRPGMTFFRGG